jgi:hypothetical protein
MASRGRQRISLFPKLAELGDQIESDYAGVFDEYEATLAVRPRRFVHLVRVRQGVALELIPHDAQRWDWYGEFGSDLEVRSRRRFARTWEYRRSFAEVEAWLRVEANA